MLEYKKEYMCVKCKSKTTVLANFEENYVINAPKRCASLNCKGTKMINVSSLNTDTCKDFQEVKIQVCAYFN